jgi:hypothetical protein
VPGSCYGCHELFLPSKHLVSSVLDIVRYTLEQCVFVYDTYMKYGSAGKCRRKFRRKFRGERVPGRQIIHSLVNKHRTTGFLIDKKTKHKRRALTEEKLHEIGARFFLLGLFEGQRLQQ